MFSSFIFLTSMFLGSILVIGSIVYFSTCIRQVISATRTGRADDMALRISEIIFGPVILLISGCILFTQGWRQAPILLLKDVLMSILLCYLLVLDLKKSYRNRRP